MLKILCQCKKDEDILGGGYYACVVEGHSKLGSMLVNCLVMLGNFGGHMCIVCLFRCEIEHAVEEERGSKVPSCILR